MNNLKIFNKHWPEDYPELHAARLLILLYKSGVGKKYKTIKSRTKLAKLDFFLRYPLYLKKAATLKGKEEELNKLEPELKIPIEPSMIRYFYGPWDNRYYLIINYLVMRNLLKVKKDNSNVDNFIITDKGIEIVEVLLKTQAYIGLKKVVEFISILFKNMTGNQLKNFIYENFPEIVTLDFKEKIEG